MYIVDIKEKDFDLTIRHWNDFTLGLFKLYADLKCNGDNDSISIQIKSDSNMNDVSNIQIDDKNIVNNINNISKKNKVGKPEIDKSIQAEIYKLYQEGKSQLFIINAIEARFGMKIHRNTVSRYGTGLKLKKN